MQPAGSELILLHLDSGEYFALDEISARIWHLCDGAHSVEEIVAAICGEYDAPEATVHADVVEVLQELQAADLVAELLL